MTIHKEGYTTIALCILFIFVSNALIQFYLPHYQTFKWIVYIFSFFLFVAVLFFFRSPSVSILPDPTAVLSPANGKIISVNNAEESEYMASSAIRITIAVSIFDAHVYRSPIAGTVKYLNYQPSASYRHATVAIESNSGITVLYKQVAGFLSRRIITYVKNGDAIEQGVQSGFGMLGSRVDVFVPPGANINVKPDDVVKAGITVLASLKA